MRRRTLLKLAGAAAGAAALAGCGGSGQRELKFTNRLRIPPLAEPAGGEAGARRFALRMQRGSREFLPGLAAATWGLNGDYLGPTLRVARGERVTMDVTNGLGSASTLHWHGVRLPAAMDGGPHQLVEPGRTWRPSWTIDQPPATAWYHPHPHGATARHVYRGLAGLLLIDDPGGAPPLPHRYGVDDIPLIVQDKIFSDDGRMVETSPPVFGLLGNDIVVNGTFDPFLEVTTSRVRFRVLNASNARTYHVGFADKRRFRVVGSDSGLLPEPVEAGRIRVSPGERYEIVAEFAPGEQVLLRSFGGGDSLDEGDFDLLKIVAAGRLEPAPDLPGRLSAEPPIRPPSGARVRRFKLNGGHAINGREMDPGRIDEVVPAGACEIWEVTNHTYAHNFHIHDVAFTVLDIDDRTPPAYERGRKDTVFVAPGKTVRLAVQFGHHTDPRTPYMYHCHILRHEDRGMMGQFVVVEPGTGNQVTGGHRHG